MLKKINSLIGRKSGREWHLIDLASKPPRVTRGRPGDSIELGGDANWSVAFTDEHAILSTEGEVGSICIDESWHSEGKEHKIGITGEYKVVAPSINGAVPFIVSGGEAPGWVKALEIEYWISLDGENREGPYSSLAEVRQQLVPGEVDSESLVWVEGSETAFFIRDIWPELIDQKRKRRNPVLGSSSTEEFDKVEGEMVCPYCRLNFEDGHLFFKSAPESPGKDAPPFLPDDWDDEGNPVDSHGYRCFDRYCPHCSERLPDSFTADANYTYFSLVGQSGSGKSYFLATLFHQLPTFLHQMGVGFLGDDAAMNREFTQLSQIPFRPGAPEMRLIDKTDNAANTQMKITLEGDRAPRSVPKPFIYKLTQGTSVVTRLVFYDNPGEHFTAVERGDLVAEQARIAASHLAFASAIFLLYDPTIDVGFANALKIEISGEGDDQKTMLDVLPERMQEQMDHSAGGRGQDTPLVVLVGKWDAWAHLAPEISRGTYEKGSGLDIGALRKNSELLSDLLNHFNTGVPAAVSAISTDVVYIPVSALGRPPVKVTVDGVAQRAPSAPAEPWDVEIPFLWALWKICPDLVKINNANDE